jgi:hypothetical protein
VKNWIVPDPKPQLPPKTFDVEVDEIDILQETNE